MSHRRTIEGTAFKEQRRVVMSLVLKKEEGRGSMGNKGKKK
jgi:hypothetical protein